MMMVDDTENREFRELLSDYTAPIRDDGFSDYVLMQAQKPRNIGMLKNLMVGGAAVLAAIIAGPQLTKLTQLLAGVNVPEVSLPANIMENANMSSMSIIALLAVMVIGLGGSFLFSGDV